MENRDILQRELDRLQRAVSELSLLNEVALAIGEARSLEAMIQAIVRRSVRAVDAEHGAVLLVDDRDGQGDQLQTLVRTTYGPSGGGGYRPDMALIGWMQVHRQPLVINDPAGDARFPGVNWPDNVRSVLCVPLLAKARLTGVLVLYNKRAHEGFSDDDRRLASILAAQSALAVGRAREAEERERVLRIFGQHSSPAIVDELLRTGPEIPGRKLDISVLFLDVRGFTTYAEQADPDEVVTYLNALFSFTVDTVVRHGGLVHQFLGDGFLAFFGAPIATADHADQAVAAATEIVGTLDELTRSGKMRPTRLGIGIHSGEVVCGTIGTSHKMQYAVTGDVVNVASRIEQLNKQFDSVVLISQAVVDRLQAPLAQMALLGDIPTRGRSATVRLYRIR